MKIESVTITSTPTELLLSEKEWIPVDDDLRISDQRAHVTLKRVTEDTIEIVGQISFMVDLLCDRCGDPFRTRLENTFSYIIKNQQEDTPQEHEKECTDEDIITVYTQEPSLDVNEILHEQLYLSIPDSRVCRKSCRGLCLVCGSSQVQGECDCQKEQADSPFAVLGKLKK